jgi:uncharacterized peroxidase-related enzyme
MSYLKEVPPDEVIQPLFDRITEDYGFVPNFYRAQTLRPDFVAAEAQLVNSVLVREGALSRRLKEYIFLVCSGANLSTYCVTAHCEIVRMLGIEGPEPEQLAIDHRQTNLPLPEKALLSYALKVTTQPTKVTARDLDALRTYGFSDPQLLETVAIVGLAKFANFIAFGLGTHPDFEPVKLPMKADA